MDELPPQAADSAADEIRQEPLPLAQDEGDESVVAGTTEAGPTVEDVMDALSNVIDPELGLDFVELGLIYGVEVGEGHVHVTFTLTTPGCPIGPQVNEQIEEFVGELDGVKSVESEMVFTPPWSPERMSEDAKFALGY
jgi:metal-sulfur cluster biosynthetic enzyme